MSNKTVGYILVVAGIVLLLLGFFADALGIGAVPGFGWKQIVAIIVGALALGVGAWLAFRRAA